ncbi:lamin tail domain-containing protein [Microbacterium sp. 18062]|uniref:lamin tail domain-containing protein n=1 Tax=Microbacterium sp. 18062 TaxID=2681410 RepID=UPI001F16C03E|nr:lamin tail domain-containing protein [Microbacterium sp. 18062]
MFRPRRTLAALTVCAIAAAGAVAVPTTALAAETGVRINEVESSGGRPGDWIELFNPTSESVVLDGHVVTDAEDDHVYAFPEGSVIEAGGFLVLDELVSGIGDFDFGLGKDDSVRLFTPEGALADEQSWTAHAPTTWGVDDAGAWAPTGEPTKGATNVFPTPSVPDSAVVLNEIVYDEVSGFTDRVEIYNAGTEPADVTGWRISDDKRDRFGDVPAATIPPGEFVVLVTDVDFSFGLGKSDEVVLYDAAGGEVDSYAYENTAPIAVWARCPDGTGEWAHATAATPGAANDCEPESVVGSVVINEVDSQPADWIEFHNPGTEAFDVSGYEIRDNSDDHRWTFRAGSVIPAGGYLVVDEASVGFVDGLETAFRDPIGIGGADRIRLFDPTGALIDDTLPWTTHAAIDGDVAAATLSRCPDGQGEFRLSYATPGATNSCVLPEIAINEIESNGDATDWVEVINLSDSVVDVSGWTVVDNDPIGHAAETFPLPKGTTIEPGGLFVFDQPGEFSFGLGNGDTVTLRDAQGIAVDEHVYAAHADGVWARCPDGIGDFADVAISTKSLRNACGSPVRVNEVESSGGEPGDWVELVNPTTGVLDVSGLVVRDDDDSHGYEIPAGTTIAAGGHHVIEEAQLGFGLGSGDSVRVFEGDVLVDSTTWTAHAATTWGRCPDTTGTFAETAESTKSAANVCVGDIVVETWPGSGSVRVVDEAAMFLEDSSGLDVQETADGVFLWAVDNGTGRFWKLVASADGSVGFAEGWELGRRARFQKDAGDAGAAGPDAEGITVDDDGWVYIASERDNNAKGVNQNIVLKVDPGAPGTDVIATTEWDLTALLPQVGANVGMEAVEWVPDADLAGRVLAAGGTAYDPAAYPGHGDGLFFVAIEDDGRVFAVALREDGTADIVAEVASGLGGVMALDYDVTEGVLWAVCDDGCGGTAARIVFGADADPAVTHVARPAGMPDLNNEGFAIAPASFTVDGHRAAWWFADGIRPGALRTGTLATVVDPVDPTNPVDTTTPTNPARPGAGGAAGAGGTDVRLPATGGVPSIGLGILAVGMLAAGILLTARRRGA